MSSFRIGCNDVDGPRFVRSEKSDHQITRSVDMIDKKHALAGTGVLGFVGEVSTMSADRGARAFRGWHIRPRMFPLVMAPVLEALVM
jgi:hypothetical protein